MYRRFRKKILAVLLSAAMVVGMLPATTLTAFALGPVTFTFDAGNGTDAFLTTTTAQWTEEGETLSFDVAGAAHVSDGSDGILGSSNFDLVSWTVSNATPPYVPISVTVSIAGKVFDLVSLDLIDQALQAGGAYSISTIKNGVTTSDVQKGNAIGNFPTPISSLGSAAVGISSFTITFTTASSSVAFFSIDNLILNNIVSVPTFTSGSSASISENATGTVYTAAAMASTGGGMVSYSISSGADAAKFNINPATGVLTFKSPPDFEAPSDTGANNVYDVNITATDSNGSATHAVAITVTNVNEDASLTSVAGQTPASPGSQTGAAPASAITSSVSVPNTKAAVGLADIVAATGATVKLYSDADFLVAITDPSTLPLTAGGTTMAYILVTAEDTITKKHYAVGINRAEETFTVTFKSSGNADIVKTVTKGATLSDIPTVPVKEGYLGAWEAVTLTNITANKVVNAIYTTSPANATVNAGNNTGFSVTTIGTGLPCQWQVNTGSGFTDVTNTGVYSGATTAALTLTGATTGMNGYLYRVKVGGVLDSGSATLTVTNLPTVTEISPSSGPAAGGTTVILTGTNLTGATAVLFGAAPATTFTVNSATQITATAPSGTSTVHITVTTPDGISATSAADQFTYIAAPTVTSVSPTSGPTAGGTSVVIKGTDFTGVSAVTFGATPATSFTFDSAVQITATAPAGSGTVDVRVTTPGGTSAISPADQFTYVPAPTVTAISPTAGPTAGGTTVTLTGTGFIGVTAITFGATPATGLTVNSGTQITAIAPAGSGTVDVRVTTPGGTSAISAADQFTYVAAPTVTSVSPTSGPTAGTTSVTIMGTGFTEATAVSFGATPATGFTVNSATQITATAPAGSGTVDVTVTTPGGTSAISAVDQFTYFSAPAVTGVSPGAGPTAGGTLVTITGTDFSGVTAVSFGATPASSFSLNPTTHVITATAPASIAGTVDIRVSTPFGTSAQNSSDFFTYVAAPTVTGISPGSGPTSGDTSVTITGTDFFAISAVSFGATPAASYIIHSATEITAVAPAGTGTVDVRVTTPGGTSATSAADEFTYVVAPTVTAISATVGSTAGGTTVIITGTHFTDATAVSFGATAATGFTVVLPTTITATAPAGTGTVDITVTTPGGTSATSAADQFTYVFAPTVTGISPTTGSIAGGNSVTIAGTHFISGSAVHFGAAAVTSITVVSPTQITATAPAGTGTVDITVTTPGGTSATSTNTRYTYVVPPAIGTQPSDAVVNEGQNTSFSVAASGSGLTYRWQVDTGSGFNDIADNSVYSGSSTASLSITGALRAMNGTSYRVIVSGTLQPPVTSQSKLLTVHPTLTVSGNAGSGGVLLSYMDGTPKTVTADGTGAYSFTVPYSWSGTVFPTKIGYTFSVPSRTYSSLTADQTAQNYTAAPNPYAITFDYQGATGGNTDLFKIAIFNEAVGTLPEPTKPSFTFDGWYTLPNGGGTKVTGATLYIHPANLLLYANWTPAGGSFGGGAPASPPAPPQSQPLTVLVTTTTGGETSSSASVAGTYNPATGTVSATVDAQLAQNLIQEALDAKEDGKKAVAHVQFGTVEGATAANVEFPRAELAQMAAARTTLQLDCGIGTITLGTSELSSIARSSAAGNITLGIEQVDTADLSAKVQAKVKDNPLYRFEISVGDTAVSRLSGSAKITIPYTPKTGMNPRTVTTYYLDSKNVLRSVKGKYDAKTGTVSFSLPRL